MSDAFAIDTRGANLARSRDTATPEALFDLFAPLRPQVVTEPLNDFSRLRASSSPFCQVSPRSADEVCRLVSVAHRHHIPLRVRGRGHALNGSSLPQAGELTVQTEQLAWVRYDEAGTVTAASGIALWTLRDVLGSEHLTLPVVNDGYAGPSVGGFIAAGGFGPGSQRYGGFWENVAEILIATGYGLRRFQRGDPSFPWLFGSMGQLGIIIEARLDVVRAAAATSAPYPQSQVVPADAINRATARASGPPADESGRRLYWFTLFVPGSRLEEALARLAWLEAQHGALFRYRERYQYFVQSRHIVAPLVYPEASPFFAIGIWGFHEDSTPAGIAHLSAFETDFMQMALRHRFKRYIQSELSCGPHMYTQYFDPAILSGFQDLKRVLDPNDLFNRGSVFLHDSVAPCESSHP